MAKEWILNNATNRFQLNFKHAAIIFSDILIVPDAMAVGLHFVEGEGPKQQCNSEGHHIMQFLSKIDINGGGRRRAFHLRNGFLTQR